MSNYNAEVERPSAVDESSDTQLSAKACAEAESKVASVMIAELEELRRKACPEEWQNMLNKQRTMPRRSAQAAGDRQVDGAPTVIQLVDSGRLMQNTLRKIGKKHTRNVRVQAFVCAGINQTMMRPVVLAFQHAFDSEEPYQFLFAH